MTDERRKIARKYLMVYSRVFDKQSGRILGHLEDLNSLGAMIIGDNPLETGLIVQLRFDLPDPEHFGREHLELTARTAWCKPDLDPSFKNIGFEFINPTPQDQQIIEKMMDLYEFHRENPPNYPPTIASLGTEL
jgi:hypothetical protein